MGKTSAKPPCPLLPYLRSEPLSQSQFMDLVLQHPLYGYYRTQKAVGQDFTTAPEISQMFGELLGAWMVGMYEKLGSPPVIHLVELGPGRGTLMADMLRIAALSPSFLQALQVHLVEVNPILKETQRERLRHPSLHWHEDMKTLPSQGPLLIMANEFFDVFPTDYYLRRDHILYERRVKVKEEELSFIFVPLREDLGEDISWEESPASLALLQALGDRLVTQGGALLLIDYGYETGQGDTLQALFEGTPSSPLTHLGHTDLTCHVNFWALKKTAEKKGLKVFGPTPQGQFLKNLGIHQRTAFLKAKNPRETGVLMAACERLTHPLQMGSLFKVLCIVSPDLRQPEGF